MHASSSKKFRERMNFLLFALHLSKVYNNTEVTSFGIILVDGEKASHCNNESDLTINLNQF